MQADPCSWPLNTTRSLLTTSLVQTIPRTSAALTPVSTKNLLQPANSQVSRKSQVQGRRQGNQSGWASRHLSTKEPRECDPDTFCKCRLSSHFDSSLRSFSLSKSFLFFLRRSCSIDKCPFSPGALSLLSQKRDMVRSESLRVDPGDRTHRIFRPSDLIHGEVLGKGFFGQAVKVSQLLPLCPFHYYGWLCCHISVRLILISTVINLLLSR